jgi:hypothetical protein
MKEFTQLLNAINAAIKQTVKSNRSVKEMISIRNYAYVIKTKDDNRGRRYIFRNGKYSSDTKVNDCDLALVFENAAIGFRAMVLDGPTGMMKAINNYELMLVGNQKIFGFFSIILGVATGILKRE